MATISFDLVSPENLIFNDEVGMIIVPGKDGDFGVLPGHSKVMSSLRPGRVMVYGEDKNLLKAFFCFSERPICLAPLFIALNCSYRINVILESQ